MSPLQKIAMGLVIVLLPANFPAHPHPAWNFYDALPDPLGWALVIAGVWALGRGSSLDLGTTKWLAVVAGVLSVPLWFPQLNHLLVPAYNTDITVSGQWFLSLPETVFALVLCRQIGLAGDRREPRDGYVASRFGVLTWGFALLVVLPAIAYGGGIVGLQNTTLLLIALVNFALIFYLFMVHRRTYLAGPGPRDWTRRPERRTRAHPEG